MALRLSTVPDCTHALILTFSPVEKEHRSLTLKHSTSSLAGASFGSAFGFDSENLGEHVRKPQSPVLCLAREFPSSSGGEGRDEGGVHIQPHT